MNTPYFIILQFNYFYDTAQDTSAVSERGTRWRWISACGTLKLCITDLLQLQTDKSILKSAKKNRSRP